MKFRIHHHDDPLERLEVALFHRMQRVSIEERDHFHRKALSISDDEDVCPGNVKAALAIDKSRDVMIFHDFDLSCWLSALTDFHYRPPSGDEYRQILRVSSK
jgi:hypothetical protein